MFILKALTYKYNEFIDEKYSNLDLALQNILDNENRKYRNME